MNKKIFPGWGSYVVLCNRRPIASFPVLQQAERFAEKRAHDYPDNQYWVEVNHKEEVTA